MISRALGTSQGVRVVIAVSVIMAVVAAGLIADYAVATWRADEAVRNSQQVLCGIVDLVTASPVPQPADPRANPSRETSYRFYQAFVTVGREYRCDEKG